MQSEFFAHFHTHTLGTTVHPSFSLSHSCLRFLLLSPSTAERETSESGFDFQLLELLKGRRFGFSRFIRTLEGIPALTSLSCCLEDLK